MKIIFLDIDGVLNSHKFLYDDGGFERQKKIDENGRKFKALDPSHAWYKAMLDPDAIKRLQTVIQTTGAKVVVSSSWRLGMDLKTLIDLFASYNIEVIDKTPMCHADFEYDTNFSNANYRDLDNPDDDRKYDERGQEIAQWLKLNNKKKLKVTSYVVIDDSGDAGEGHKERFVKTKWESGFLDEHIDETIRILNS